MKSFKATVSRFFSEPTSLIEVLRKLTSAPDELLYEATEKGAVWIQEKGRGKTLRLRSPEKKINPLDVIYIYIDAKVLKFSEPHGVKLISENKHYGIWIKPAGVVPQGTQTGDHASLLRYVEKQKNKEVFLIHRLDRETEGVMVVGYSSEAAAKLSKLFQDNKVKKIYEAIVLGELEKGLKRTIDLTLDDKEAITHFEVLGNQNGKSLLRIELKTGRLHQIRRHLDGIGYPIIGDPKYGKNNKNRAGLKLLAFALSFEDPWTKKTETWQLEEHLSL